ncbi:MAG: 50S ribosome-binding GTPase [Planctomycetes bacterium]|nr:50S ribosome-binding GTPase [Planctomycetota bacterium]
MLTVERVHALRPLVDRMEAFTRECDVLPGLTLDRESILGLLQQLRDLEEALGTPLKVLLVGGTGAGKSTLLNAIAGADIAKVSALRPTTREFVCYYHRAAGTATLGAIEATATLRPHDRPELREKILLDAPDFDSALRDNRRLLLDALRTVDLVLCLVTPEKYLSAELFRLLEEHRQGRSFVFLMNRMDQCADDRLLEDFRSALRTAGLGEFPVFRISARNALENRLVRGRGVPAAEAVPLPEGDFAALETFLERELDRVRIREIKSRNLVERVDLVLSRIERHVPEKAEERLVAWKRERDDALVALVDEVSRRLLDPLFRADAMPALVGAVWMSRFRFLFGVFASFFQRLEALADSRAGRPPRADPHAAATVVRGRLQKLDRPALTAPLTLFGRRVRDRGRAAGFACPPALQDPAEAAAETAVQAVEHDLLAAVEGLHDPEAELRGIGLLDLAFNLPPTAFVALFLWQVFRGFFEGRPIGLDHLVSALLILTTLCYAEWALARRVARRSVTRAARALEERAWRAVRLSLGDQTGASGRALAQVEARLRDLRALRADFARFRREAP